MLKAKNLQDAVNKSLLFSEILAPYTFPKASPFMEDVYNPFRIWNFSLDGYDVCVHITCFEIDNNYAKNIQIFSKELITLPFHLVWKIAVAFFGFKNIVFFYFIRDGRQIFCWTCLNDKDGNIVEYSNANDIKIEYYMGHEYARIIS